MFEFQGLKVEFAQIPWGWRGAEVAQSPPQCWEKTQGKKEFQMTFLDKGDAML